jgi:F0F1-type ATP synthase assembly protein I
MKHPWKFIGEMISAFVFAVAFGWFMDAKEGELPHYFMLSLIVGLLWREQERA